MKLEKPQNGQAVTIHLDGNTKLDLSDIASEKLTFVRVGEKLIVLFDNQSTVTVDPVFDSGGHPLADVAFDLGQNRLVTGDQFATLFPITTDQSVLPAAGASSGPTGGAHFSDVHVNALTDPNAPLALLGDENNGSSFGSLNQESGSAPVASQPFSNASLNEANLPSGTTANAGPTTITGLLGVNFGSGLGSALLTFNETQPGLAGLRSQGEIVNFALSADHMTLIGFVGGDPNVAANQVFIVTLNLSADSSYTVTLLRPLDHSAAGADTLGFTLDITAQDTFGSVETHVTINVQDDVVGLNGLVAAHDVTEDGLAGANGFVAGDGSTGAVEMNINWGADNDTRGNTAGDTFGRTLSFQADGVPTITGENGAVLSSGGVALQYVVTPLANGGELLTAYKGDARGDDARVFTLTLDPTSAHGSYTFNLLGTLDHATGSNLIGLTFAVQAADDDGDTVNTNFTVNVTDDVPVTSGEVAPHNVTEDGLADANGFVAGAGSTGTVELNINWGTDNDTRGNGAGDTFGRTLSFVADGVPTITGENGTVLSSGGVALQYVVTTLANGGELLTAYKGDARDDGARVFTLTLDPTSEHGSYSFNLLGTLDHAKGSDSISLSFGVQAADADGDTVNTSFTVNVADDLPVTSGEVEPHNVTEDGLPGANGFVDGAGATGAVDLNVNWGADNDKRAEGDTFGRTLSFLSGSGSEGDPTLTPLSGSGQPVAHLAFAVTGENGGVLSSGGVVLQYIVTALENGGELLTAYKGSARGDDDRVFTVTLDPTSDHGSYSFNLLGTLDHAKGSDSISLSFGVQAADADGDTVNTSFTVNVIDDVPVIGTPVVAQIVGEDGLGGANLSGGSYDAANDASVNGIALNVNWGADNDTRGEHDLVGRTLSFNRVGGVPVDGSGHALALSSDGVPLQYVVTTLDNGGEMLQAYRGGTHDASTLVFTVTLDPTSEHGSYSFVLNGNLDHAASGALGDELPVDFGLTATDSDGDTVGTHFTVKVQDDVPVVGTAGTASVNEDDLPNGNDLFKETRTVHGDLAISWGADDGAARHILMATGGLPAGLTSDGIGIDYQTTVDADGNAVVMAYKHGGSAAHAADQVFSLSFNESGSGTYTFRLLGNLDHAEGSDDRALQFTVDAYDSDGDSAAQSFTVHVADDHPIAVGTILPRYVEEEELNGGNEDTQGAGDSDFSVFGFPVDVTTAHADGLLNILWGGDDANRQVNGGYDGAQVAGDRSVVFGGAGGAYIADGAVDAGVASQFLSVGGGHGGVGLADLTSGGEHLVYTLSLNGTVLTATTESSHKPVFTVTLSDVNGGAYNFQLNGVLDHPVQTSNGPAGEDTLSLNFTFTARDGDGDIAQNSFTVNVIDDVPVIGAPVAGAVTEHGAIVGLANSSFEADSLAAGAPGVITDSRGNYTYSAPTGWIITGGNGGLFAPTNAISDASQHSGGNVVWLRDGAMLAQDTGTTLIAGNNYTLHFDLGDRTDQSFPGGTVRLIATNGVTSFELASAFLQAPADGEWRGVDLSSGPIDSSLAGYELRIEIQHPGGTGDQILIDNVGLDVFTPSTDSNSLDIKWGADHEPTHVSVAFNGLPDATGLSSNGQAVHYELASATLLKAISADGRTVFTVELSSDGSGKYTFALLDNLDHLGAHGTDLPLNFSFKATDADGDTAVGSFKVDVFDQALTSTGDVTASVVLDDDAQAGGNPGGTDDVADATSVSGAAGALFAAGADGVKSITLDSSTAFKAIHIDGNGVSHQESVSATLISTAPDGSTTWTFSSASIAKVATLTINADGSYNFTTYAALVHPTPGVSEENLPLTFHYTATDGDNDAVSGSLTVNVNDDTPTAQYSGRLTLQETADSSGHFVEQSATGQFHFAPGADGAQVTSITYDFGSKINDPDVPQGTPFTTVALLSHGTPVVVTQSADHLTLIGMAGTTKVFEVTVTDPTTGAYKFTQYAPIDHPDHNESGASDPLRMKVSFTVTDGDGDTATNSVQLDILDDAPTVAGSNAAINLLTNGDFAGGTFAHQESWGQWATEDTGWLIQGTANGQTGVQLERIPNHYLNMATSDGHPMVDLGASPGNIQISQTISGLAAGQQLTLSFEFGSPSPGSAGLAVYWNNQLIPVETLSPTGTMTLHTLNLVAAAGDNVLTFKEIGNPNDNTGTYLANISLTEAGGAAQPVFHADAQENDPQTFHFVNGTDFHFGADGAGSVAFDIAHATIAAPSGTTLGIPALSYDLATGTLTMTPGTAFDSLGEGEIATLTVPFTITDADGDTKTGTYQFTIHGTNDAPVITSGAGAASGDVSEAGDLASIVEAGVGGALHLSAGLAAQIAASSVATDALAHVLTNPSEVSSTITTLMSELPIDEATAIAVVWKTFDGPYLSNPGQLNINQGFTYLGLAYDTYLKNGGSPLVDVTAKYTADGNNNGTPDRLQSLHDNLLGNVTDYALHQRYDAANLYQQMHDLVAGQDANLLTRSPQPVQGNESDPANLASDAHAFDLSHDYATHTGGQLAAHDVDVGDSLTWSADHLNGTYGTFTLDATSGKWTYVLDDTLPDTEKLGAGETTTETFVATVTDGHGGSASQTVTVTIHGTNDAPVITTPASQSQATVYEAGTLAHVVSADVAADHKFSITPHLNPVAGSATDPTTADTAAEMKGVVLAVQAQLGAGATFADAIATVWDNLDHNYTNYYATDVNKASVLLGLVYADYVQHGGAPLTDVIVKYAVDGGLGYIHGGVADGIVDRSQSLHDNLLGAVDTPSINDKFSSDQTLLADLKAQIAAAGLTDRPIYSGNEGADPSATIAFDQQHNLLGNGGRVPVGGQLAATDIDSNDAGQLHWSADHLNGTYGAFTLDATSGKWTYTLDDTLPATEALGAGETTTETFVATVTDGHGGSASQTVTVTIHGTNDAPVITTPASQSQATLHEDGGLDGVRTADVGPQYNFEPDQNLDTQIASLLADTNNSMHDVLVAVQTVLGHAAGMADAIAAVWDYIDDVYTGSDGYYKTDLNAAGVRLGIEYAKYVQDGGEPLTNVIAKYATDGNNNGTPDRLQSLHDNLLGNLDYPSMVDKFLGAGQGSNPQPNHALFDTLIAEIDAAHLDGRPIYGGYEGSNASLTHQWDVDHGLLPGGPYQAVTGQLSATDVDANDAGQLTWSGNADGTYGTFAVAADGKWTYTLDNSRTETQALAANETHTETFVAIVNDGHGGSASQTVSVTVIGTNDAPVIVEQSIAVVNGNFEADTSYQTVNAPEGSYSNGSPQGWTVSGPTYGGWFAPNNTSLPDAHGTHGNNVLWLNDGQTATQTVGTAAVGHYQLSVDVGDRIDANLTGMPAYSISLYAGSTLVATHVTTATTADGPAWATVTLGADIDATLAGQPLSIRLQNLEAPGSGGDFTQQVQVDFDNVKLDFVPARNLSTITEDDIANGGQTVASILGNSVTDVDHNAVQGIAIIGDNAGNGTWQYQDASHNWVNFGTYSTTAALLLTADDVVRFLPNGAHGTTASFDYVAWDQTSGATYATADVSTRGGSTAFSTETGHAVIDVTSINDAPQLQQVTDVTGTEDTPVYLAQAEHAWFAFDPDAAFAREVQVSLTLKVDPAQGILSASRDGLSGTFDIVSNGDGSLTITTTALPGDSRDAIDLLNTLLRGDNFGPNNHNGITFTPAPNFNGDVTVNYTLDDHGYSGAPGTSTSSGQFNIHIDAVNDAPVAVADSYVTGANTALTVDAAHGLVSNDTDAEHSVLASILNQGPSHGSLSLNADGSFTYTPTAGFSGQDSFTYHANDGSLDSNIATVTIDVTAPPNAAPLPAADHIYTNVATGQAVIIPTAGLLWNDTDPDSVLSIKTLSGASFTDNTHQYIQINSPVLNGDVHFTYTVSDGINPESAPVDVTLTHNATLTTNSGSNFLIYGDAGAIATYGYGGNDVIVANTGGGARIMGDSYYFPDTGSDSGRDLLIGSNVANDALYGGKQDDVLNGRGGGDALYGDAGNDILIGGLGTDTLTGGTGADTFVFNESGALNKDVITDYNRGSGSYDQNEGDKIDLSGLLDSIFNQGANAGNNTISNYVQIVSQSGTATLQVDLTGGTGGNHETHSWQDVAALTGVSNAEIVNIAFAHQDHHISMA